MPMDLNFSIKMESLKDENWNETWEKNFYQPIIIGEEVLVKSSFHKNRPQSKLYDCNRP